MSFHSWLQNLRSALAPRRGQRDLRRQGARRAPAHRLSLEVLEDRSLLAFSPAVSYPVGPYPQAVVTGEFNNDGRLDLATASFESDSVSVLLGTGAGTFTPAQTSSTGAKPLSMAVGDFNQDGNLDLATANQGGDNVSVLLGQGDGTFQASSNIDIGSAPSSVAVGDFNGDGKLDLGVVSNAIDPYDYAPFGEANVLLGTGDGSFSGPTTTFIDYGYHTAAVVADFNGDGKQDLAATNADYAQISLLLGDGQGGWFGGGVFGTTGDSPMSVVARDVNGDAKLDVVTANYYGSVSVLLGNGVGGILTSRNYEAGSVLASVVLGDFNRDGKLDITTANSSVCIFRGIGDGTFATMETFAPDTYGSAVTVGDWNGDGWLDVATANADTDSASILINDQSWPFVAPTVSVSDAAVTEGNTGTVNATFALTLAHASNVDVTVHYATADITASAGSDYTAASGDVVIPAGRTSRTFTVAVKGDRIAEPNETFVVNLSSPTNATIADGQGAGTLVDDEPRISISDVTKAEGKKNQTTLFTFTVTLSAAYDQAVTISFRTVDGTATTSDQDYVAKSGTLTFAPGETTKTITIEIKGDNKKEANETFYVDLFGNSGNSLFTKKRGFGTILNDD